MRDSVGDLFNKCCCYFYISGEGKGDGLIGWNFGTFAIKEFDLLHRHEGLHLCEHDSTVRVQFCLSEFLMLKRICVLSSCTGCPRKEVPKVPTLILDTSYCKNLKLYQCKNNYLKFLWYPGCSRDRINLDVINT